MTDSTTPSALIQTLANDRATAAAARTGGSLIYVQPAAVEILDTVTDPVAGHTTVWFVFDFILYHGAQSGSDWYYHHVLAGSATILDERVVDSAIVQLCEHYITEFQMEWAPELERYDRRRERSAVCAVWWAKTRALRDRAP